MTRPTTDWRKCFPFETVRPEQEAAIEAVLDAWDKGKKYVCIEAGTGVGKSAIAVCLARVLDREYGEKSYLLTSQKILQRQYEESFGDASSVWSSSNYDCTLLRGLSCGEVGRLERALGSDKKGKRKQAPCAGTCPYKLSKESFLGNSVGVTNYAYFLASTMYGNFIEPRGMLVLDEAHRLEDELSSWVGLRTKRSFCSKLGIDYPADMKMEALKSWLSTDLAPAIELRMRILKDDISANLQWENNRDKLKRTAGEYDRLDRNICAVHRFNDMHGDAEWVLSRDEGEDPTVSLTPIIVAPFTKRDLFRYGDRVLFMSATILDFNMWRGTMGLKKNECAHVRIPSPFAVENRPVIYSPVGKMSMRDIDRTVPKLCKRIKEILKAHPNEKGIIHCTSYKVAGMIKDRVKDSRLLFQKRGESAQALVDRHGMEEGPTVLVSPAMMEGVDLKENLSRFQIIAKLPYKYLGDPVVKARMDKIGGWYASCTARSIMQAAGRSVRSEEDKATTYVLDECFSGFLNRSGHLFPPEFIDAIEVKE